MSVAVVAAVGVLVAARVVRVHDVQRETHWSAHLIKYIFIKKKSNTLPKTSFPATRPRTRPRAMVSTRRTPARSAAATMKRRATSRSPPPRRRSATPDATRERKEEKKPPRKSNLNSHHGYEFGGPIGALFITLLLPLVCYFLVAACNEATGCVEVSNFLRTRFNSRRK